MDQDATGEIQFEELMEGLGRLGINMKQSEVCLIHSPLPLYEYVVPWSHICSAMVAYMLCHGRSSP